MADKPAYALSAEAYGLAGEHLSPAGSEVECRDGTRPGGHMEPVNAQAKADTQRAAGGRKYFAVRWPPPGFPPSYVRPTQGDEP